MPPTNQEQEASDEACSLRQANLLAAWQRQDCQREEAHKWRPQHPQVCQIIMFAPFFFLSLLFSLAPLSHASLRVSISLESTTEDPSHRSAVAFLDLGRPPRRDVFTVDTNAQRTIYGCTGHRLVKTPMTFDDSIPPTSPITAASGPPITLSGIQVLCRASSNVAALGPSKHALPRQVAKAGSLPATFALCLPVPEVRLPGALYFGAQGYFTPSAIGNQHLDLRKIPMKIAQGSYWVQLRAVEMVDFRNSTRWALPKRTKAMVGTGSTYTRLPNATFSALRDQLLEVFAAAGIERIEEETMGQLDLCFNMNSASLPDLPEVRLVLGHDTEVQITAASYLVPSRKTPGVSCFGFVSGAPASIGMYQMGGTLYEFDLASKTLGISIPLISYSVSTCYQTF